MIQLASRESCTGCSACENICPTYAINMAPDFEGFLQPLINTKECIECHLCEKKCPVISPSEKQENNTDAYALISKDDLKKSSSGGAFSVFSRWILSQEGIIYGASLNEDLTVSHLGVDKITDLHLLRGSKYVQSKIGSSLYKEIQKHLSQKRKVLFSGTPCQVAGLYNFLGKEYEDYLITIDLVCHGVPSPSVFNTYLRKLEEEHISLGKIINFQFRKVDSWSITPTVKFSKSSWKMLEDYENIYIDAFYRGWTYRECCFSCKYANLKREGTFTIADFWGIGKHGIPFKKNISRGVSLVIDNKGIIQKNITELNKLAYIEKRTIDEAVYDNYNLKAPVKREKQRDQAIIDMLDKSMSLHDYAKKYKLLKIRNIKYFILKYGKRLVISLGLFNLVKTIAYRVK